MPYTPDKPFDKGFLKVSDVHSIYYQQVGNPQGQPVAVLHGGPGGDGRQPRHQVHHDPTHYRLILFDQRGAGKSIPSAELAENTTWHIVADMEKLRYKLRIESWQIFGGSWGSTVALAYAEKHPERVSALVLYSLFTFSTREVDFLFKDGASRLRPEAFEKFRDYVSEKEREDLLVAFRKRVFSDDEVEAVMAVKAWTTWRMCTSRLVADHDRIFKAVDAISSQSLPMAKLEFQYFSNLGWLRDGQLTEATAIDRIRHIPCVLIHGRYDAICPVSNAWNLKKLWPEIQLFIVEDAGHSPKDGGMQEALVRAVNSLRHQRG